MAGALGVELGGVTYYDGQPWDKPTIGEEIVPLAAGHIRWANAVMFVTAGLFLLLSGTDRVSKLVRRADRRHRQSSGWRNTVQEIEASVRGSQLNPRVAQSAAIGRRPVISDQPPSSSSSGISLAGMATRMDLATPGSRVISPNSSSLTII